MKSKKNKKIKNQRFLKHSSFQRKSKCGQMKLSFGMIFSIILIVIFIAFAFWGVKKFLAYQNKLQIGQFITYIQEDIDKMARSFEGSSEQSYALPKKVEYLCFTDFTKPSKGPNATFYNDFQLVSNGEKNNMFFYPLESAEGIESVKIEKIDIVNITSQSNPYCISNEGGITLIIKKDIGENLVKIQ